MRPLPPRTTASPTGAARGAGPAAPGKPGGEAQAASAAKAPAKTAPKAPVAARGDGRAPLRALHQRIDPAADAAGLLRRLGFFILVFAVPITAMWARRATVILVPIGTALLALAALLDSSSTPSLRGLRAALTSPGGLCGLLMLGWAALSITWTPFPEPAINKIINVITMVLVALVGVASLPERMRSSNLYLVPVGVGLAALVALAIGVLRLRDGISLPDDVDPLDRGMLVLAVMVWPAVAWLVSRARYGGAFLLMTLVCVAALLAGEPAPLIGMVAGMVVYVVVALGGRRGITAVSVALPAILVMAPLFPFLLRPFLKFFHGPMYPGATALRLWAEVMGREPVQLLTGHGLDTTIRARLVGMLPLDAPQTMPFEIWYELGIVGALSGAAALGLALASSARLHKALVPGVMAAYGSVFAIACVGTANAQAWFLSVLGATVLTFVAIERGQVRTSRPGLSQLMRRMVKADGAS